MEYEILKTGVFDQDRYFDVFVEYAKASPEDILICITVANRGSEARRGPGKVLMLFLKLFAVLALTVIACVFACSKKGPS